MKLDTLEGLQQEIAAIYGESEQNLRSWLYKEIIINAVKFKRDDLGELDLKIMNRAMAEFRHAARVFQPYRRTRKVSIFGSARTGEAEPYYDMAVRFARALVDKGFMVITGAAEGIMKAGNAGAGAKNSFGANILVPFEQDANEVIATDPKLLTFRYFFIRKLFFVMEAHAVALFPGGFGTHDEAFETLTLLQTGKTPPMPFVLMELPGDDYWESWDRFIKNQMLRRGLISLEDRSLYKIVQTVEDGVEWIRSFYRVFHSMRQVGDKLVVRLEKEFSEQEIEELNEQFHDLATEGKIERADPFPVEANEPTLADKPRIVFSYNGAKPSRLTEMILAINGLEAAADAWGQIPA